MQQKIDWKTIAVIIATLLSIAIAVIGLHEASHEVETIRIENNRFSIERMLKTIGLLSNQTNNLEIKVARLETKIGI